MIFCHGFYPVPIYRSSIDTRTLSWHVESISVQSVCALLQPVTNDHAAHISEKSLLTVPVLLSLAPGIDTELRGARLNSFFPRTLALDFALPIMLHSSRLGPVSLLFFCSIHNQLMVSLGVTLSLQVSFASLESTYTKWLFAK